MPFCLLFKNCDSFPVYHHSVREPVKSSVPSTDSVRDIPSYQSVPETSVTGKGVSDGVCGPADAWVYWTVHNASSVVSMTIVGPGRTKSQPTVFGEKVNFRWKVETNGTYQVSLLAHGKPLAKSPYTVNFCAAPAIKPCQRLLIERAQHPQPGPSTGPIVIDAIINGCRKRVSKAPPGYTHPPHKIRKLDKVAPGVIRDRFGSGKKYNKKSGEFENDIDFDQHARYAGVSLRQAVKDFQACLPDRFTIDNNKYTRELLDELILYKKEQQKYCKGLAAQAGLKIKSVKRKLNKK